jgi:hypothetical protein
MLIVADWVLQDLWETNLQSATHGNFHVSIGILGLGEIGEGGDQEGEEL